MPQATAFGNRVQALRKEGGLTAQTLAQRLHKVYASDWKHGGGSRGRARIANIEAGRTTSVTRGECRALELALGADTDELWQLLLQEDRKVDSEVRGYYQERIRQLGAASTLTAGQQEVLAKASAVEREVIGQGLSDPGTLLASLSSILDASRGAMDADLNPLRAPRRLIAMLLLEKPILPTEDLAVLYRELRENGRREVLLVDFLVLLAAVPHDEMPAQLGNFVRTLMRLHAMLASADSSGLAPRHKGPINIRPDASPTLDASPALRRIAEDAMARAAKEDPDAT